MKKLSFILMLLISFGAFAAAQMWCLNGTTQCSYGTPSLNKLDKEERAASIFKLTVAKYNEAVNGNVFEAITANELIKRAKAYLAAQVPTDPEPEVCPDGTEGTFPNCTPIDTRTPDEPLDMNTLSECAIKGADGCWMTTEKERTFYLIAGNQWEKKITNGWGTSCLVNTNEGFPSTDIKAEEAYSCFVLVEASPSLPTEQECVAQGKILSNEGTECIDAPPQEEQMPPPTPTNNMPAIDMSRLPARDNGSSTLDIENTTQTVANGTENGGQFRNNCRYSHALNDDPVVYPNQEGASHNHTFFGNTGINANADMNKASEYGNGTCNGGIANRSGYWSPSLVDTATNLVIKPWFAVFYYKTGKPNTVIAPPKGLRMIAGTSSAQSAQGGFREILRWTCNDVYAGRQESIPACSGKLSKLVAFPSCWDGKNLDSPDHKAHMAYSDNGTCPASHPLQIPDITVNIHYQVPSTNRLRLSSDNYIGGAGGFSGHADWVNGWNEAVMNQIVNGCLRARKDCHADLLGNGQALFNKNESWHTRVPLK
ncbi:MAG: DUF1996 domain-containing protein [Methylophilaceae bacterium]